MIRVIRTALPVAVSTLILSFTAQANFAYELETTDVYSSVIGTGFVALPSADGYLTNVGDVVFSFSGSGFS